MCIDQYLCVYLIYLLNWSFIHGYEYYRKYSMFWNTEVSVSVIRRWNMRLVPSARLTNVCVPVSSWTRLTPNICLSFEVVLGEHRNTLWLHHVIHSQKDLDAPTYIDGGEKTTIIIWQGEKHARRNPHEGRYEVQRERKRINYRERDSKTEQIICLRATGAYRCLLFVLRKIAVA